MVAKSGAKSIAISSKKGKLQEKVIRIINFFPTMIL